jgi:hypothetical protein
MAYSSDDWQPSVEESLRRLQNDTATTEAGNNAANAASLKSRASAQDSGVGDALKSIAKGIAAAKWNDNSPTIGAQLGGAGSAVSQGMFGGGATAPDTAAYAGGTAPSTVLPGILPGATGITGATGGGQGIFGGNVAGAQDQSSAWASLAAKTGVLGQAIKKLF